MKHMLVNLSCNQSSVCLSVCLTVCLSVCSLFQTLGSLMTSKKNKMSERSNEGGLRRGREVREPQSPLLLLLLLFLFCSSPTTESPERVSLSANHMKGALVYLFVN